MTGSAQRARTRPSAPQIDSVIVERGVRAPMRDGVELEADLYRPRGDGPYPVLVMRLPYDKHVWQAQGVPAPTYLAAAGFIVVVQDVRGRFGSDGLFDSPIQELADGADTIAWAARLSGSSGDVATFGPSYLAHVQWAAALESPPALRAMIPMVSPSDSYFDGFVFRGGAFELSRLGWGTGSVGQDAVARRTDIDDDEKRRLLDEMLERQENSDYLRTRPLSALAGDRTPVADAVDIWSKPFADLAREPTMTRGRYSEIHAAVFLIGGWYDCFLGSTLAQYEGLRRSGTSDPLHLVVGPWTHMEAGRRLGEVDFGADAAHTAMGGDLPLVDQHVRWFDATISGERNLLDDVAPVRLFIMGENRWRSFDHFPPATQPLDLYLDPSGGLSENSATEPTVQQYLYDPTDPTPTLGGATILYGHAPGPFDQRSLYERADLIGFQTDPLKTAVTVVGYVEVTLFASTSAVDTDFVVRLCDVHPSGNSIGIADGIIRARYRASYDHTGWAGPHPESAVTPGEFVQYRFSLWATAHSFLPGHRIRVDVTSSSFPRWDPNLNTGEPAWSGTTSIVATQRISTGGDQSSRVRLPILQPDN